ncbi:hypothetical protein [Tsukamurella spumae]|uniref:Uncharacterized protein n=1 Tax=Tsukamurella spumae TaxID=44753 RepID=A0A846X094_9ACTN|nr:hypothetical protein [Tsukamurella spumae]NKY18908.1 hypothetical protein [Tsukamurella spumae]
MSDTEFWPRSPGEFAGAAEQYRAAHAEARRIASRLGVRAPSDVLLRAGELDEARAAFVGDYAVLVEDTRERMTGIAARTALARLDARGGRPPGDPAADEAADLADLRGRAEAQDAAEEAERRSGELAAGHGSAVGAMAPLGGLGVLGRSLGADGAHRAAHYVVPVAAPADLDLRLRELCAAIGGAARDWVRIAVAEVVDEAGRPWRLIGTTELDGYLRPGVVLRDGELAAGNEDWPELSIATFCAARGFAPGPVVGATPPPDEVCDHLRASGFAPSWSGDAWAAGGGDVDAQVD